MKTHKFISLLIMASLMFFAHAASATPSGLTFQGRLVDNGVPVEGNPVLLTIKVMSPGANECLLLEETHSLNMTNSDGIFTVKIGGGARTSNDKAFSLTKVFSNTGAAINSLTCGGGATSYTSAATDSRNVYVTFVDNGNTVAFTSPYVIQSVPYALEAERLSGKSSTDFLQTVSALEATPGTTQARMTRILDTDYTGLDALLSGTSTQYMSTSATEGTSLPILSSQPATLSAGKMWYEGGVVKYYDGVSTTIKTLGTSSGSGSTDAIAKGGQSGALSLGTSDSNALTLNTNNSARMTILPSGFVGIGTTAPGAELEIAKETGTSGLPAPVSLRLRSTSTGGGFTDGAWAKIEFYSDDASYGGSKPHAYIGTHYTTAASPYGNGGVSDLIFAMAPNASPYAVVEAMRLSRYGNLGIGTTSPGFPLDVVTTTAATAISGSNSAAAGIGVTGNAAHSTGFGVYGTNTANSAYAIKGYASGSASTGVYGLSAAGGVHGQATSTATGIGVLGAATGAANTGYGVQAVNNSATGWALYASGTSPSYFQGAVGIGTTAPTGSALVVSTSGNGISVSSGGNNTALNATSSSGSAVSGTSSSGNGVYGTSGSRAVSALGSNGGTGVYSLANMNSGSKFAIGTYTEIAGTNNIGYGLQVVNTSSVGWGVYASGSSPNYFAGNVGIGTTAPGVKLEVNGGVRINTASGKPTCNSTARGTFWVSQGGAAVKDQVEVCAKDATDAYAWRTLY